VASPAALLSAWELGARAGVIDTRFFPPPSEITRAAIQVTASGELPDAVSITVQRIAVGFLLGALPAIVLGLAMGLLPWARALLRPLIDATFPVPKIAVLPLFLLIFGFGEVSKWAIIAVGVFYLVLINTFAGVRNLDAIYFDVARNYRAGPLLMFFDVALPGALPLILTGLKLGMGVALLVIVAAEFVGARGGLGYMVWSSWQAFEVDKMYVALVTIAVIGLLSSVLLDVIERVLVPWRPRG
jgi:NitT/TauT family transport system permease protein